MVEMFQQTFTDASSLSYIGQGSMLHSGSSDAPSALQCPSDILHHTGGGYCEDHASSSAP